MSTGHSTELPSASVSKRVLVHNLSYEKTFYSHVHFHACKSNSRFSTRTLKQRQMPTRKWPIIHKITLDLPVHDVPFPSYPPRQRQTYEPSVLVHTALESQSFSPSFSHSSRSTFHKERNRFLILLKQDFSRNFPFMIWYPSTPFYLTIKIPVTKVAKD